MRIPDFAGTLSIDRGPWPNSDFPTRRVNNFGVHHAFPSDIASGGTKTRSTLISSFERNGEARIAQFNPKTILNDDVEALKEPTKRLLFNETNLIGVNRIILDMKNVTSFSSSGLGFLVTISQTAGKRNPPIKLYVINSSPILLNALGVTNLNRLAIPMDSLDDAIKA